MEHLGIEKRSGSDLMVFREKVKYRILAVDDEEILLHLYKEILGFSNRNLENGADIHEVNARLPGFKSNDNIDPVFDVTICSQGHDAVEAVRKAMLENNPYSVAFIDVRMPPGPNGVWTAEKIRAIDPFLEIVIVTGYSDIAPEDIMQCIQPAHRLLYMQKPFHAHEIWQLATALCSKWSLERFLVRMHGELEEQVRDRTIEISRITHDLNKTHQFANTISLKDPITGLNNKKYFNKAIEDWVLHAKKYDVPLSLLVFDIDSFVEYSEDKGRFEGDKVLCEIGRIVKNSLRRKSDTPFSDMQSIYKLGIYGFAIILPCTDKPGAVALADRLRANIEEHTGFTIKIGVSELNQATDNKDKLIEDAKKNFESNTET